MFVKGNKLGRGRPKGSFNDATRLKNYLIKLLLSNKAALKKMKSTEMLRIIAPLLPKEQTIHQNTEPITINIDTKKEDKTLIESTTPTTNRISTEIEEVNKDNNE